MEIELGSFIQKKTNAKVKMKNFDINLNIEIIHRNTYVFIEKIRGPGGLPVGISGNIIAFLENKNSVLTALLMLKRGCNVIPVAFKNFDVSDIEKYSPTIKLIRIKNIKEINSLIQKHKIKGIAVKDTINNVRDSNFEVPIYRPLISFNQEGIELLLRGFLK